jgi:hypothetical protein
MRGAEELKKEEELQAKELSTGRKGRGRSGVGKGKKMNDSMICTYTYTIDR